MQNKERAARLWVILAGLGVGCGQMPPQQSQAGAEGPASSNSKPATRVSTQRSAVMGRVSFDGCSTTERAYITEALNIGRVMAQSETFRRCMLTEEQYLPCSQDRSRSLNDALFAARRANPIHIQCRQLPNAKGRVEPQYVYQPLHPYTERIQLGRKLLLERMARVPYRERIGTIGGIIWHELMHSHGYEHGRGDYCGPRRLDPESQQCQDLNKILWAAECGQIYTLWDYEEHSMPFVVQHCMGRAIDDGFDDIFEAERKVAVSTEERLLYYRLMGLGLITRPRELKEAIEAGAHSYRLRSSDARVCVDVPGGTPSAYPLQGFPCHRGANQQWQLIPLGSHGVMLRSKASGLCMDVPGFSHGDVQVQQYTCNGGANQRFTLQQTGESVRLRAQHSGRCIELRGSRLMQTSCTSRGFAMDTQLSEHDPQLSYLIVSESSSACLDVRGGVSTPIQIRHYNCRYTPWAEWRFESQGESSYRIRSASTGQCITRAENYHGLFRIVRQRPCDNSFGQTWLATRRADGSYRLSDPSGLECASIAPNSTWGWIRATYGCEDTPAQRWSINSM